MLTTLLTAFLTPILKKSKGIKKNGHKKTPFYWGSFISFISVYFISFNNFPST